MKLQLIFVLVFSSTVSFSQQWSFKAELGANVSGIPKSDKLGSGKERILPKIRPVIGIQFQRQSSLRFYGGVDVRYTNTGAKIVFKRTDFDPLTNASYTIDSKEEFSFMKLSYGLHAGYKFYVLKLPFSVMGGIRRNFYPTGRYHYTYRATQTDRQEYSFEKLFNPFESTSLQRSANQNGWEAFLGLTLTLADRYSVQCQYSRNNGISFVENASGHTPYDWHSYSAGDFSLCLVYKIGK